VLLWPDTFNNFFHPETAKAALLVLEGLGFDVLLPPQLCCGRPLYDYGFLNMARRRLEETVAALRPQIRAGVPMVGLEPSCIAVFRDELVAMLPGDADAKRLSEQTWTLSEFIGRYAAEAQLPLVGGVALVQGHCHH
jgi:Fe-S oxidoreductase